MTEWKEIELGELCEIKGGKRLPKGEQLSETITNHPYIRTRDLANNKIAIQDLLFVPNNVFPKISRYIVDEGDIIISIVGTIGLVARIPKALHLASLTENCAKLVEIDQKMIDKEFLFYFLISDEGQDEIDQRNVGSTQPKLPLYNIKSIPIPIPSLPEQRAIASVLSSLDDKIDLLHRQNKTLEQMAEALFRQWFVVEASEEWEVGLLGDLLELKYGKALKKEVRSGNGFPVVGSSGIVDYHSDYFVEGPGIVIGRKGTLGKVIYLYNNFYPIDTTFYVEPRNGIGYSFLYYLLKSIDFKEMNSDSAVPGLNRNIALSQELTIPPLESINKFELFAHNVFNKIIKNQTQIRTLEKMRDTLLPKLMSGEVRVISIETHGRASQRDNRASQQRQQ